LKHDNTGNYSTDKDDTLSTDESKRSSGISYSEKNSSDSFQPGEDIDDDDDYDENDVSNNNLGLEAEDFESLEETYNKKMETQELEQNDSDFTLDETEIPEKNYFPCNSIMSKNTFKVVSKCIKEKGGIK